jgi:hypothetical protein
LADLVKYAFVAGEISPTLYSRSDLEKYDLAVAEATNWFVDYRGGLSTRPGTQFVDFVEDDDLNTKFVPFKFSPSADETYVLLFTHLKVRFLQQGAYVLEASKAITAATQATPGVVTSAAHGYSNGDWVKIYDVVGMTELNGRTFQIAGVAANTFQLIDPLTGATVNTTGYGAYVSGGTVARIYTVTTPYDADDLPSLRAHQSRSALYLTHRSYKTRTLTRNSHTSWTLAQVSFGNGITRPSAVAVNAGAGTAGVGFQVTAVDIDGVESLPSDYAFDTTAVDYASSAGQAVVTWTAVAGAVYYKVYRTQIIPTGSEANRAMSVGFVGIAYGPKFVDRNIIPDFTLTPPTHNNPFADGAIEYITVTAGGAGYTAASVVSVTTGTGSGFVGYAVVEGGAVVAIAVLNGGSGYLAGDTINVSVGAGATFTKTLSAASGNDPGVSSVFQQRKVYAGSDNDPLTVWGSRPGDYENMDVSTITQEDDSYEFEIDSEEVAPINHLLATRSGLVIISQSGIWQLTGGQGVAVTPTNALADPQSYTGCSTLPPLQIDTDIVYQESKGSTVRLMAYNDYTKVFAGQDLSILSSHLVPPELPITAWTYASDPFKLVHAVRSDGVMLELTLVKEQNIFGWTRQETQGLYVDVLAMQEDTTDVVYYMTQRLINGRYTKMIETGVRRSFTDVEDAWCVDAGLTNAPNYPAATLQAAAATGETGIVFTASAGVFSVGDVGKVIRGGGGKMIIETYDSATQVTCAIMRDITRVIPQTSTPLPFASGEWSMDEAITELTGLWHLEGETVRVLGDGSVQPNRVVTNGSITLQTAASRIIVGLGYECVMKLLPTTASAEPIEGRRKIVKAVKARQYNSRGLKFGTSLADLMPLKERTDEPYSEPTRLQSGITRSLTPANYNYDAQPYIVQEDPLPATVLGVVLEVQLGDSPGRG